MIRRTILAAFTVGIVVTEARAQANLARPQILATRIDAAPRVDGRLDDAVWANARWTSGFTQREPVEGAPATSPTRIAIAYDDDALYIAARMESATPVRALVTRRDREGSSEQLVVSLDTYHDLRTSYSFAVTAAGVRIDYHHAEDNRSSREYTFDPVWEARTAIDSGGWTAEIRIPFTQTALRGDAEADVGNQCGTHHPGAGRRGLPRPRAPQRIGRASRFAELVGIADIRPSRRLELTPYVATDTRVRGAPDARNPFEKRSASSARAGGDLKLGLGPNLTLDATFNSDFGQV